MLINFTPTLIWAVGSGLSVCLGLGLFLVTTRRLWSLDYWRLSITPLWLWLGSVSMLMVVEQSWARWTIVLGAPLLIGLFLDQARQYHRQPTLYQPYSLEHLSGTANILAIFAVFASLYGVRLWLGLSWIFLIPVSLSAVALLTHQTFWVNKIDHRTSGRWLAAISLIIPELFIAVGFLPTGYLVNALIVAAGFYLVVNLGRLSLLKSVTRRALSQYLSISIAVIALALLTARWI